MGHNTETLREPDLGNFTAGVVREMMKEYAGGGESGGELGEESAKRYYDYTDELAGELGLLTVKQLQLAEDFGEAVELHEQELPVPSTKEEAQIFANIISNQMIALWYLFESGSLCEEVEKQAGINDDTDKITLAVEVARRYLESVAGRNKDTEFYRNKYLPPIGLEAEFVLTGKVNMRDLDQARETQAGIIYLYSDSEYDDKPERLLEAAQIRRGAYNYRREFTERASSQTVGEIMQEPSASPVTQLRQLLLLTKSGIISPNLALHINVGGLRLEEKLEELDDKSHTEAMIVSTMIAACGYMSKFYKQGVPLYAPFKEHYAKKSYDRHGEGGNCYPMHKGRPPKVGDFKPEFGDVSVEYRAIGVYNNYANMVKGVESTYWLSVAAIAKQRAEDPKYRDDLTNQKLADEWDSFEQEWTGFLRTSVKPAIELAIPESVRQLTEDTQRRYPHYFQDVIIDPVTTPYNRAFGLIVSLAETNEVFRNYSRNLMIRHRAKIKQIIDESKETPRSKETVESIV